MQMSTRFLGAGLAGLAALWCLPAAALFKTVNPDGTITYSDRPPQSAPNTRVTNLARPGTPLVSDPDIALPSELRAAMARHPVTLYSTSECSPCETGRLLLATRGVPYSERRVGTEEDAQAFERLFGTRTLPLLTVGAQPLKGLSDVEWAAYLDAAGYPRQSRLPRGWQPPPATPMVERSAPAATARAPAAPAPATAPEPVDIPITPGGNLRF